MRLFLNKIFYLLFFTLISVQALAKQELSVVIANVNNHIITRFDVLDRYKFVINFTKIKINSPQEKSALLNQIIDKMIDEELIRQESQKFQITVSEQEIDIILDSIAHKQKRNVSSLKSYFNEKNISFSAYKEQIKADLLWSKIVSESVKSHIKITDQEIKEYLEQQKLETDIIKYFIGEIYIPSSENGKILATKLYEELKGGADFKDFVKQFSSSVSSENNGELGWVSKSDLNPQIFDAIHKLGKNSYSPPIFLADGYYIFKLIDKKRMTDIKEDDINFARNRIFMRELEIEGKSYLMELRKRSFIEVYRNRLDISENI